MKVLVTGGAGYIGSHTALGLLEAGHEVMVVDSLVNSSLESITRVQDLANRPIDFRRVDLLDAAALDTLLAEGGIDAVIHFAGFKAVGESVDDPLKYFVNNVVGTLNLLQSMEKHRVKTLVFSSSATVYGDSDAVPLVEKTPLNAVNPYGRTKEHIEDILSDLGRADPSWRIGVLRYFNPAGAHRSGLIGEDPQGLPNNLLPFLAQVAVGRHQKVRIFGNDYPTVDGTGVRDYVHVMDLASGHLAALEYLKEKAGVFSWNLGTGKGSSVMEVLDSFSTVVGHAIPHEFVARRAGDVATSYADASAALVDLGWSAERSLLEMCADHWRWQNMNPNGYVSQPGSVDAPLVDNVEPITS